MEKYNLLRDALQEMMAIDDKHHDIAVMIQRELSQIHKVEGMRDSVIDSLWAYARLTSSLKPTGGTYLKYVGSIIEFERECESLSKAILAVPSEVPVKAKRKRTKSPRNLR